MFENRPHNVLSGVKVDAFIITRFFLAGMEKLDLLTGKSDYTQDGFNILCAAILFRTIIPGNSEYGRAIEPKSALMDSGPEVGTVLEGVTVIGTTPVRWTIHDLISDYYRLRVASTLLEATFFWIRLKPRRFHYCGQPQAEV